MSGMMKWHSALSQEKSTEDALAESIGQIKARIGNTTPDLAVLFVSPHHRQSYNLISSAVVRQLGPRHMLGCSGGGVIGAAHEVEGAPALSLTVATLPGVEIKSFRFDDAGIPNPDSGPRVWEEAVGVKASAEPQFIVLADPFSIRVDALLTGLDFAYPMAAKVGGLASAASGPGQNALFLDHHLHRDGAVGLALSGDIRMDTLVAQGCRPIGKPLTITRCNKQVLFELDKRPALEMLTEIFHQSSERDQHLIRNGNSFLGLIMDPFKQDEPKAGDFLIRNPIGMDTERGALVIGAMLREGQTVQFHVRDAEAAGEDLASVLRRYSTEHLNASKGEAVPAPPSGALLFSCLGRGKHLYGRADHDTGAFEAELGNVPLAGFFCNGEIGPVASTTHIHGFTSCFAIFRPKAE